MEEMSVKDFLSVFRRRKRLFIVVATIVFLASLLVAIRWSNYRSTATVEIALPEKSSNATESAGAAGSREALADLRISYLQQKVLSTGSLVEIITKFNLYPDDRAIAPIAEVAAKMRKKIAIDLVGGALANPASVQKASAGQLSAIAFNLSFDHHVPLLAQQVANELVSRFLDEDIKQRRSQAKETTNFLDAQIKGLEESLADQEKRIAEFRTTYGDTRPDTLAFNQQTATNLMMSLQSIEGQIASNMGSQGALRAQLAAIEPYSRIIADGQVLTTPSIQLRALKSEYATLTAKYGAEHPDVIKIVRQIESLQKQTGSSGDTGVLHALLNDARAKLSAVQQTKGAEHPDVVSLNARIKGLEDQIKSAPKKSDLGLGVKTDADNPAYLAVVAQLRSAVEQGAALQSQKESLQRQLERYQKAIIQNPEVEQQMAALARDYENAQARYREIKAKKLESEMNESIEENRVGQRLVIINPPELPTRTKPSRAVFILVGFVFALLGGSTAVIGVQLVRQSVVGARHLSAVVGVAPLIVIPHLTTEAERSKATRKQINAAIFFLIALMAGMIVFSHLVMPLDVLASVVTLKLGLY